MLAPWPGLAGRLWVRGKNAGEEGREATGTGRRPGGAVGPHCQKKRRVRLDNPTHRRPKGRRGSQVQTIAVQPWSDPLAAELVTWPDSLLHRLAAAGVGVVEPELPSEGGAVVWRHTSRLSGERRELARS